MVAPRFSPKSGGGGFVITKNLIEALYKRGHDVELWASDYEATNEDLVKRDYKVIHFDTNITLLGFHITLDLYNWAAHVLFNANYKDLDDFKQFDVIHLQGCRTFQNIVVSHYARKYKIPYIVDAHGFPVQGTWFHKLILKTFDFMFANTIVRGAEYCIAETEVGKQEYLRAGVKEERIKIIPCPYDLAIFDDLPSKGIFKIKYGLANKRIIGFLGGLDRIKGLDFLVDAFAKLKERKDLVLVLAGTDMGFKKELDAQIEQLGIKDRVIFTGYISGRDKLEYLVDCDVCVFPSRAEQGLPFAALEAIMCGVPIIVTDGTGAAEDLRKMKADCIVEFGNIDMLCIQIVYLIAKGKNLIISTMVKEQQDYIRQNLSIEEKVKDYEKIYSDSINSFCESLWENYRS